MVADGGGGLRNSQNTSKPPSTQWEYWDSEKWVADDTSLTLEFTTLSPICKLVRVAGEGDVVEEQDLSLGDYRLEEGRWIEGRPIFKKVGGETRFLFVSEEEAQWEIRSSTTDTAYIRSGKATNSPASPEAESSVHAGVTRWTYWDGSSFVEGDISVSCV